jgi:hypothetical protein
MHIFRLSYEYAQYTGISNNNLSSQYLPFPAANKVSTTDANII